MRKTWRNGVLFLVAIPSLFFCCQQNQDNIKLTEKLVEAPKENILNIK